MEPWSTLPTILRTDTMGLLQLSNHVVQKSPYWRANDALVQVKQSHYIWIFFVQHVPVRHLLSSLAICTTWPLSCKRPISFHSALLERNSKFFTVTFRFTFHVSRNHKRPDAWHCLLATPNIGLISKQTKLATVTDLINVLHQREWRRAYAWNVGSLICYGVQRWWWTLLINKIFFLFLPHKRNFSLNVSILLFTLSWPKILTPKQGYQKLRYFFLASN